MPNPNVTVSPEMSLPVPNLADPGPDYASNVNTCLDIIDGHTHTGAPADGKQIELSAQIVTADVQLNDHNLGTVRSVELQNQPGTLIGTQDVNCLYVNNNVLGFNDHTGTFIPLTTGATAPVTNNFSAITVTTNHAILATDTYNFIGCDSTGGAIAITLPRAATILPNPQWRFYRIQDISGAASTHAITIQVTGGSGDTFVLTSATSVTIQTPLGYIDVVTDGVSIWHVWDQTTWNAGEVLDINGGALNFGGGANIKGTVAAAPLTVSGTVTFASTTLSVDSASALNVDTALGASTSHALIYKLANVTIANTGNTTLSTSQYNCPILIIGTVTLIGTAAILFPSFVGAIWELNTSAVTLAGNHINVAVGSSGAQTLNVAQTNFRIICYAANAFYIFTSNG